MKRSGIGGDLLPFLIIALALFFTFILWLTSCTLNITISGTAPAFEVPADQPQTKNM